MSAAHTPGPWSRNIRPARKYPVVFSGRNTHVAFLANDSRVSDEEAEANINLIAAAPELLEALLKISEGDAYNSDGMRTIARAAIAKATGATP